MRILAPDMPRLKSVLTAVALLGLGVALFYLQLRGGWSASVESRPAATPSGRNQEAAAPSVAPRSSAVEAIVRSVQSRALPLPLRRSREPRLAFGRDVIARLTEGGVKLHALPSGEVALELALEAPRAVLSLADGAILAIGGRAMVRLEATKKPIALARPFLLPGAEVFADAQVADRLWVFSTQSDGATLSSFRLEPERGHGVRLPEQVIALGGPPQGTLGQTREGVWLYFGPDRVERFGPGGARLAPLRLQSLPARFAVLPARRLDQAHLLAEDGSVTRALVSPVFKHLGDSALVPSPFRAETGDEGRLVALLAITGAGPRFELFTFDENLAPRGRAPMPWDEPTGRDDWVKAVTENQQLAVAPRRPLVAVGGPDRLLVFDGRGQSILSIPSR